MFGVNGVIAVVFVVSEHRTEQETALTQLRSKVEENVMERLMKHSRVTLLRVPVSSIAYL